MQFDVVKNIRDPWDKARKEGRYVVVFLENTMPIDFHFARYLVTGINPPHYGGLRRTGAADSFDYNGCIDAPSCVAAGSTECLGLGQAGESAPSLIRRTEMA